MIVYALLKLWRVFGNEEREAVLMMKNAEGVEK